MSTELGSHDTPKASRRKACRLSSYFLLLFLIDLAPGFSLCSQQPNSTAVTWQGWVRDASGAPAEGAKVRLVTGARSAQAITSTGGAFRFNEMLPGQYHLTVEIGGLTYEYAQPIDLAAGAKPALIEISSRGEITVNVQEEPVSATGGEALSSQAVSELPLNKRDFSQLLLLAAGTMTDANGATNFTQQFAINGQRGVEATFAMDGADISDPEMGGSTFSNFNVDAVESIQSSSGWMPAEIGRGAAGFTDIVTRSGAAGFHGSIFEFVRNSAFDARNYFDHPTPAYPGRIPPFRRNEFGLTNGGPVYLPHLYDGRKTTFYFAQYQGFRQVLGTTQVMPVPTKDERAGVDAVTYPDGSTDTLNVPVNPAISAILARYPLPNDTAGPYLTRTYATPSKVATDADQFSVRIDFSPSAKDRFFARFNLDNLTGPTTNPDQTAIDPAFGVTYIDRQRNVIGTWSRTATARLGFESSISITRSTPGFPTLDYSDPAVKFNDGLYEAFNSAAGSVMQAYGNLFQGRENVTYTVGQHAWKAGFEALLNRDTTYFGISPNGEYDFGGGTAYATEAIHSQSGKHNMNPGDPLPDTLSGFLSGSAFAYTVAVAPPYFSNGPHIGPAAINRNNFSAYVQDTWKMTPRFTLDYGVRWDLYTPISERAHRTSSFLYGQRHAGVCRQSATGLPDQRDRDFRAARPGCLASARQFAGARGRRHHGDSAQHLAGQLPHRFHAVCRLSACDCRRRCAHPLWLPITPAQLPRAYTPAGVDIFASGNTKTFAPNTVMDVNRYESDVAALTPGHVVSALNLSGIDRSFGNATLLYLDGWAWSASLAT